MSNRQTSFFNVQEKPAENWCYIIEIRFPLQDGQFGCVDWNEWCMSSLAGVNHFRTEERATEWMEKLKTEHSRKIALGLMEFRVAPKYIGYVPDKDEVWII